MGTAAFGCPAERSEAQPEQLLSVFDPQSSANNFKICPQNNIDRFRISNVFLLQDPRPKRVLVVAAEHRNSLLHNDRAMIQFFIHKMHRAAGNLHTISESLLLRLQPRKSRQQRGMDIENPPRKLLHKPWRKQTHVPGKANQIDIMLLEHTDNFAVMLFRVLPFDGITTALRPRCRAVATPGASARLEITTAMRASAMRPASTLSAIATKFEPRPERRMPRECIAVRMIIHRGDTKAGGITSLANSTLEKQHIEGFLSASVVSWPFQL